MLMIRLHFIDSIDLLAIDDIDEAMQHNLALNYVYLMQRLYQFSMKESDLVFTQQVSLMASLPSRRDRPILDCCHEG